MYFKLQPINLLYFYLTINNTKNFHVNKNLIDNLVHRNYVIEKRDLSHGGGWVPAISNINSSQNHATVPRLLEGTTYEFRCIAENLQGRSDPLVTSKPVVAKNQFGKTIYDISLNNCIFFI